MSVASRYQGVCGTCDERYPEGTPIVKTGETWSHEVCPEPSDDYDVSGGICSTCFLTIALSGACGCDEDER